MIFQHGAFGARAASRAAARGSPGSFSFALGSWVTALADNWASDNRLLNASPLSTDLYFYWNLIKPQMLLYTLIPQPGFCSLGIFPSFLRGLGYIRTLCPHRRQQRCPGAAARSPLERELSTGDQSHALKFRVRPGKCGQNPGTGTCEPGQTEPPFHLQPLQNSWGAGKPTGKIPVLAERQGSNSRSCWVSGLGQSETQVAGVTNPSLEEKPLVWPRGWDFWCCAVA